MMKGIFCVRLEFNLNKVTIQGMKHINYLLLILAQGHTTNYIFTVIIEIIYTDQ